MRSLLFVPGDDTRKLEKGLASGADALIIDLEDSVALSRKTVARETTAAFLAGQAGRPGPQLFVRVNPFGTGLTEDDAAAAVRGGAAGVVLPKAEGRASVQRLSSILSVAEAEDGREDGKTLILAIATETARALFQMGSYEGASLRLMGLTWGGEDLSADLGAETNRLPDGGYAPPYLLARNLTLFAAAAAGVAPVDSVYTNFRDAEGLRAEAEAARRDGFTAKMAIHPAQVPVINEVFTPSPEAIARARAIVAAFEADPAAGVIGIEGEMIDRPHLIRAQRILARART